MDIAECMQMVHIGMHVESIVVVHGVRMGRIGVVELLLLLLLHHLLMLMMHGLKLQLLTVDVLLQVLHLIVRIHVVMHGLRRRHDTGGERRRQGWWRTHAGTRNGHQE